MSLLKSARNSVTSWEVPFVALVVADSLYQRGRTLSVYTVTTIQAIKQSAAKEANIVEATVDGSIILPPSRDTHIAQNERDNGNKNVERDTKMDVISHLVSGGATAASTLGKLRNLAITLIPS
jgi:hypothetical protein